MHDAQRDSDVLSLLDNIPYEPFSFGPVEYISTFQAYVVNDNSTS